MEYISTNQILLTCFSLKKIFSSLLTETKFFSSLLTKKKCLWAYQCASNASFRKKNLRSWQSIQIDCQWCKILRTNIAAGCPAITGCYNYSAGNCCSAPALTSVRVAAGVVERGQIVLR
jgi:hypothetical protein